MRKTLLLAIFVAAIFGCGKSETVKVGAGEPDGPYAASINKAKALEPIRESNDQGFENGQGPQ